MPKHRSVDRVTLYRNFCKQRKGDRYTWSGLIFGFITRKINSVNEKEYQKQYQQQWKLRNPDYHKEYYRKHLSDKLNMCRRCKTVEIPKRHRYCAPCLDRQIKDQRSKVKDSRPEYPKCQHCDKFFEKPKRRRSTCSECKKARRFEYWLRYRGEVRGVTTEYRSVEQRRVEHQAKLIENKKHTHSKQCLNCGKEFLLSVKQKNIYCGEVCRKAKIKQNRARWMENNRMYVRERRKQWAKNNPEKERARRQAVSNKRRLSLQVASGLSSKEWREIQRRFNGACAYCGDPEGTTMDHIIPISRGGDHCPENVLPACFRCNCELKGAKTLEEWRPDLVSILGPGVIVGG